MSNRTVIEKTVSQGLSQNRCHSKVNEQYQDLNALLFEWYCQLQEFHGEISITESIITTKANRLAAKLGLTNFKASNGWICSFKSRYNIRSYQVSEIQMIICSEIWQERGRSNEQG